MARDAKRKCSRANLCISYIEEIINDKLPENAKKFFTSWDNITPGMQNCWIDAGWKTVMVDLENERVKFRRKPGV